MVFQDTVDIQVLELVVTVALVELAHQDIVGTQVYLDTQAIQEVVFQVIQDLVDLV